MTSNGPADSSPPPDEMSDVVTRVRQLDPSIKEAAVRGYMREMADADALLDTIELGDAPLSVSHSVFWADGDVR